MVVFQSGFRVFFLSASVYAAAAMLLWIGSLQGYWGVGAYGIPATQWHAHMLIYGYAMAVIAGFLLTAVANWTGRQTAGRSLLVVMWSAWLLARMFPMLFQGAVVIKLALAADLVFALALAWAIALPVIKSRQWRQLAIITKVILLMGLNMGFYLAILEQQFLTSQNLLFAGLYLIVGLILTVGRRVIPFFTERALPETVPLQQSRFLDVASLLLFMVFFVAEVFGFAGQWLAVVCTMAAVVVLVRMNRWLKPGVWSRPLLWGLYLSLISIALGFALFAAHYALGWSKIPAIHAWGIGGLGLMTLAMMARVSWGHTGRPIAYPPQQCRWVFLLLVVAVIVRVGVPQILPAFINIAWLVSGIAWIAAFVAFVMLFAPVWYTTRIDGRPG